MSYSAAEVDSLFALTKFESTTKWYEEKKFHRNARHATNADTQLTIQNTARLVKHAERQQYKMKMIASLPNCTMYVVRAFCEHVDMETNRLSREGYLRVCEDFGCINLTYAQDLFDELDMSSTGTVSLPDLMSLIGSCVLDEFVAKCCFEAFDPRSCGFIIQRLLKNLRSEGLETFQICKGKVKCTHYLVTALLNVLDEVVKQEDAALLAAMGKQAKKKDAKPPTPVQRKFHISFPEFREFYLVNSQLFMALFPIIIYALMGKRSKNVTK